MSDSRSLGDLRTVCKSLDSSRATVERALRSDRDFPAPVDICGSRKWFMDEIEHYKATRRRRQYAHRAA